MKNKNRKTDLGVNSAGIATPYSCVAGRVLQTETGFVSLSHLLSRGGIKQVIVTEGLHTVEMSGETQEQWR